MVARCTIYSNIKKSLPTLCVCVASMTLETTYITSINTFNPFVCVMHNVCLRLLKYTFIHILPNAITKNRD